MNSLIVKIRCVDNEDVFFVLKAIESLERHVLELTCLKVKNMNMLSGNEKKNCISFPQLNIFQKMLNTSNDIQPNGKKSFMLLDAERKNRPMLKS